MMKKKNPLSYLGWLGVLGLFGVCFAPTLVPFVLFFTFFSYGKMIPDELFWQNVNRASARGFWSVFGLDSMILLIMFIRGMTIGSTGEPVPTTIHGNSVTIHAFLFDQYNIAFFTFLGSITLMILVFTVSMHRFKKQEKRMLEVEE